MSGIWIAILLILGLIGIAFLKANLKICPPNQIMIFSGKKRKLKDGTVVGYRVIKGGRAFKIPIIESVQWISLETIPIEFELSGALSKGLIPLNLKCMANIKIAGNEEQGLYNAVERFLGRSQEEISRVARQTLEGGTRGVLATLTPEEANTQRLKFAQLVMQDVSEDFRRLGIVLDTFKIQDISDNQHYLEAIGRKKNAEVQRDAKIAEAEAEAEARKVSAEARERGRIAEIQAEMMIVESENEYRVKTAELEAVSNRAEAKAKLAGEIARTQEEKTLADEKIKLNRSKYEAEVVIPAQAEKEAKELKAKGDSAKIIEDGKATAEAVKCMREEWEKGDTKDLFLIQLLPDIIDKISKVISENLSIEKLTIVDGGDGQGLPNHIKSLTGSVVSFIEGLKNATGLDITQILQKRGNASRG